MNHERKPFDDKRVRKALTLALDRWEASKSLSKIAVVKEVAGIQVPGTQWATPPSRAGEARRLRARHHGGPRGGAAAAARGGRARRLRRSPSRTAASRSPTSPVGIWLLDQWRQIGLQVKQEVIEASAYHPMLARGGYDVAMDFQCSFVVEPDVDIVKFQSANLSDNNFGRYKDPVLDDLFVRQAQADRRGRAQALPARLREAPPRRGGALHLHAAVAPHHPAQRESARLDHHPRALPQQSARHRLAGGVDRPCPRS